MSFDPISGNIGTPLGQHQLDSGENWRKLELFGFKFKIFTSKMVQNQQLSLTFQFLNLPCIL